MNKTEITVPNDISIAKDVADWIIAEVEALNVPNLDFVLVCVSQTDRTQWEENDFIGSGFLFNQQTAFPLMRSRSSGSKQYVQTRNSSSTTDTIKLHQGQKITIMYA